MARGVRPGIAAATLAALCAAAQASEFRSVTEPTVLYDAPSVQSTKRFVLGRGYPLQVLVKLDAMTKVRDSGGDIGWVENKALTDTRTVVVTAAAAEVRASPAPEAPTVFRAERGVLLEVDEAPANGWIKVHHRDGEGGYARVGDVWGE
jgi:SH3-like domain-containing protein